MADAADRGCKVRLLYDVEGSNTSNGMPTDPAVYDFLKKHGHLFVQAGPGSTTHPYMTTSVLKRFAGFFRKQAFIK